jgi:ornithine carbamoyltransferase
MTRKPVSESAHTMPRSLKYRSVTEFSAMSDADAGALLAAARELQTAARAGVARRVLRGKNLAMLCDDADAAGAAALFHRAASELGAQVAQLRPSLSERSTPEQVRDTARLLGRLYDALDCIGLPSQLVRQIGAAAGVPVFEAISSSSHPTARLATQLNGDAAPEDKRCAVMQAVLLGALA